MEEQRASWEGRKKERELRRKRKTISAMTFQFSCAELQIFDFACNTCSTFRRKMYRHVFHSKYSYNNMRFVLKMAIQQYFWVVRRFHFVSVHLMPNSAMITQLSCQNVADFPHVSVFKNCLSSQGNYGTLRAKKMANLTDIYREVYQRVN